MYKNHFWDSIKYKYEWYLGEKPSAVKIVAMTSLLFGVVMVCKPSFIFTNQQVINSEYTVNNNKEYKAV